MMVAELQLPLLAILIGCSSPDFEAGHRHPIEPGVMILQEVGKGGPVAWSCMTRWTSTAVWRRYVKDRASNICFCTAKEPDLHTDIRHVYAPAGDRPTANVAWWRSWRSDPRSDLKHVVQGPLCTEETAR